MGNIVNKLINISDLFYLAFTLVICNFFAVSDFVKAYISLPYFIIIPYTIGNLLYFLIIKDDNKHYNIFNSIISVWCLGILFLFFMAIFLQVIGVFNIYLYIILTFIFVFISKIYSNKDVFNYYTILEKLFKKRAKLIELILVLAVGLIPPIILSQIWTFPLKFESDGFNFILLTKEIIQQNNINLFYTIHLPIESVILSIPCVIFNIDVSNYLWSLTLLIYPIYALCVFYLSVWTRVNKWCRNWFLLD